jgi:hypothetical protein
MNDLRDGWFYLILGVVFFVGLACGISLGHDHVVKQCGDFGKFVDGKVIYECTADKRI